MPERKWYDMPPIGDGPGPYEAVIQMHTWDWSTPVWVGYSFWNGHREITGTWSQECKNRDEVSFTIGYLIHWATTHGAKTENVDVWLQDYSPTA